MFGFGKRKQQSSPTTDRGGRSGQGGNPIIAALLLAGEAFDVAALAKRLSGITLGDRTPGDIAVDGGILTFQLGDELIAIAPMPAPYPWSDLKGPCETTWMWPKGASAAQAIRPHRSHVLVTAIGGSADAVSRRIALTQVVSIAAQQGGSGVAAIHWPEGTLVLYPPVFIQLAQKFTKPVPPLLYLWVDFRVIRNPDGSTGMFTTGLRPLGLMEIEIPRISMPPSELRDWMLNVVWYLFENHSKVKDGHTIGMSATQQIRIRHLPSVFGHEGTVMQLQA